MRQPIIRGRRLLEWTPRGDSLEPIWLRLRTWRLIAAALLQRDCWPWGRGWGSLGHDLRRHRSGTGEMVMTEHAFCEPLELVYESGILGVVALVGWGWLVLLHLRLHDPWSAALVIWALTTCGSITARTWPCSALGALLTVMVASR